MASSSKSTHARWFLVAGGLWVVILPHFVELALDTAILRSDLRHDFEGLVQDKTMKRNGWTIARMGKHHYRLADLKNHYLVDTLDGTELGWCRTIHFSRFSIFSDSCWVELELYQDGLLNTCLYSLGRFLDLAPTPKSYSYALLCYDLHCARLAWLGASEVLSMSIYKDYQRLAAWQPWLLEVAGRWSWAEYRQAIALHLLSTVDELPPQPVAVYSSRK